MRMLDRSAQKRTASARPPALATRGRRVAIFTSLDATPIDRRMLSRLARAGVPLVPVTVLTLNEIEPVVNEMPTVDRMIIEAGGAVARRAGDQWSVDPCGPDADALLDVIAEIEDRSGASLVVCSALPGSIRRSFSEPFMIERGALDDVARAAESIGYSIRRGPRAFHLRRTSDEGTAFERVKQELACDITIAAGSTPIDAAFLRRADIPILLPGPEGANLDLLQEVPNVRIAPAGGAGGWEAGVERALDEVTRRLSRNRQRRVAEVNGAGVK